MPGEILITGIDGKHVILTRQEPKVGEETLGVMKAIDGNNRAEVLHLWEKRRYICRIYADGLSKQKRRLVRSHGYHY